MKTTLFKSTLIATLCSAAVQAQVWRASDYEEALRLAAANKADIAVYQHGSDWNRLGQFLLTEVWDTKALETALAGERVVLVAIDDPETPGNPPVAGRIDTAAQPDYRPVAPPDPKLEAEAKARIERNKGFMWRGIAAPCVPRIAVMDMQGRPVASEDKPRVGLTPAELGTRIRRHIALRKERDEVWAAAESQQGAAKAASLVEGLKLVGRGKPASKNEPYQAVYDQISATKDPAALRWMQFPTDQRFLPELVVKATNLANRKQFEKAAEQIDAELTHPANQLLSPQQRQVILLGKFNIVRQWPGHEEKRWEVLQQIIDLDPKSYLGLGAHGQFLMNHREESPSTIVHGWAPSQIKSGTNTWNFHRDVEHYFDLTGPHTVKILHNKGTDTLRIRSVRLLSGSTLLSEASPNADLAPGGHVVCKLTRPDGQAADNLVLQVVVEAPADKADVTGRFAIEPDL